MHANFRIAIAKMTGSAGQKGMPMHYFTQNPFADLFDTSLKLAYFIYVKKIHTATRRKFFV
jgi:hypothetical protein